MGTRWWWKVLERHLSLPGLRAGSKLTSTGADGGTCLSPQSGSFSGFRAVEQLGVLGCAGEHPFLQGAAMGACNPPSSPPGCLGGCWWHVSQLSPCTPSPPAIPPGSARDFFHRSEEAELIQQHSLGQRRSFLKFLVLIFLKLRILRHETQHPLAPEALPQLWLSPASQCPVKALPHPRATGGCHPLPNSPQVLNGGKMGFSGHLGVPQRTARAGRGTAATGECSRQCLS